MSREVKHGVFQDIFGNDLQYFDEELEDNEVAGPYYSVRAYKRVNGKHYFVGEMKSHAEPSNDTVALTIKNFNADYAEIHIIYEMF